MKAIICIVLIPLMSPGTVGFERQVVYEGAVVHSAQAADYNGDGLKDIIFTGGGGVHLALSPEYASRQIKALPAPFRPGSFHSNIMDVDDDGDMDFIAENRGLYWLECPENPVAGDWQMHWISRDFTGIHNVTIHDVDEDGRPDIVVNNFMPRSRRAAFFRALGLQGFFERHSGKKGKSPNKYPASILWFAVPSDPRNSENWTPHILADEDAFGGSHYISFADINGDGHDEALVGCKGKPFRKGDYFAYWTRGENVLQPWKKKTLPGKHRGATHLHGMDLNGDGKTDLAGSLGHGVGITLFEAPDLKPRRVDSELLYPHAFEIADIEGDGDVDLFCCAYGSKTALWYENDGSGAFTRHLLSENQQAYDIFICDLDNDHDLDLVVAGYKSMNVAVFRQK